MRTFREKFRMPEIEREEIDERKCRFSFSYHSIISSRLKCVIVARICISNGESDLFFLVNRRNAFWTPMPSFLKIPLRRRYLPEPYNVSMEDRWDASLGIEGNDVFDWDWDSPAESMLGCDKTFSAIRSFRKKILLEWQRNWIRLFFSPKSRYFFCHTHKEKVSDRS